MIRPKKHFRDYEIDYFVKDRKIENYEREIYLQYISIYVGIIMHK